MPPQLEKNHVVPTAWQDEALARDGVSTLRGLQETRVATREESGVLGFPSRRGLTPRGLEVDIETQELFSHFKTAPTFARDQATQVNYNVKLLHFGME